MARSGRKLREFPLPKLYVFPSTSMSELSQSAAASSQRQQADNAERFLITILANGTTVSIVHYLSPSIHIFLAQVITNMKIISALIVAAATASSAFVVPSTGSSAVASSTRMQMGLFDFFSEDARQEREARKRAEIEEQERLQREIIERRKNPEKMEEYEAKVKVRRALRMAGEDEMATKVQMFGEKKE